MAKGEQPTQTTTSEPSQQAQQIIGLAMPGIQKFAAQVPQRYQGSSVAPFDPSQVAGQEMALGAAGTQAGLAGSGAGAANTFLSGNIWDPSANPNLQGAISAATRPITQNLAETLLPAIRSDAIHTGNFGGSRQGVAEGIATRGAEQAIGDTASKLVQSQYDTNVDAQLKALGLLPTVQSAQTQPAVTTSGVGDVRQALQQALLSQTVGNFNYDEYAPFLQSQELLGLAAGIPGGQTQSTGNVAQPNMGLQTLSGAAAGATLGSALFPGAGTAVGAGAGALLPWLFHS
jgi:hypothetical protein